jgi:DNA-binding transcriptional ArsR family regulator
MKKTREQSIRIREFILENLSGHPEDITRITADEFGISRPAVLRHLSHLIDQGLITASGATRDRQYKFATIADESFSFEITPETEEDHIWRHLIRPVVTDVSNNVLRICEYGASEMINNIIDHSEGTISTIRIKQTAVRLEFMLADNGVGIFKKIQRNLGLRDPRYAILELAKGKVTTDPDHHTGEGIFFTSRAFDDFLILSRGLSFSQNEPGGDWLIEQDIDVEGTTVSMGINPNSKRRLKDVFDAFASEEDDYEFNRTQVPVTLATFGDENLVSRSQARRLSSRFERFQEVLLDFKGVETVGQAFADEIFRIYTRNHPNVEILAINTNEQIEWMIARARGRA